MQGVPADLPVDQERIRARLLQMSATNQKSSQINTTHIYCIESQTSIKRTLKTRKTYVWFQTANVVPSYVRLLRPP